LVGGKLLVNPSDLSRFLAKLQSHPLPQKILGQPLLREKRFWAAAAGSLLLATLLVFWIGRTLRHREMQRVLNAQEAFHSPPLGIMFPQVAPDTPAHRDLLAAGERRQYWVVQPRAGESGRLEIRVTDAGRRFFSPVGSQILATFGAGRREVTRVLRVEEFNPTRRIRFRYRWTELHPAMSVLGEAAPDAAQEYEGEALASFENQRWRIVHWTTPHEEAVARFRELGSPASRGP